jgi:hypothetical protein
MVFKVVPNQYKAFPKTPKRKKGLEEVGYFTFSHIESHRWCTMPMSAGSDPHENSHKESS